MKIKSPFLKTKFFVFFLISFFIILLDQILKYFAKNLDGTILIPHFLTWTYVLNTGAAFGILPGGKFILGIFSLIVVGVILWFLFKEELNRVQLISLAFIFGGALGNAYDRFLRVGVIDFLNLGWFPVFNVADSFVVIGVIMLIVYEILNGIQNKK